MALTTQRHMEKQSLITDKQALDHVDRINRKIKIKNTWIIILVILLLASAAYIALHHLSII